MSKHMSLFLPLLLTAVMLSGCHQNGASLLPDPAPFVLRPPQCFAHAFQQDTVALTWVRGDTVAADYIVERKELEKAYAPLCTLKTLATESTFIYGDAGFPRDSPFQYRIRASYRGQVSDAVHSFVLMWTESQMASPLQNTRFDHTATLLPGGDVLIAGGSSWWQSQTAPCELYHAASNVWTAAGRLNQERRAHTALLLDDASVLIAGGRLTDAHFNSCERYELETRAWQQAAPMHQPRSDHTAVLLDNGSVLVSGGHPSNSNYTSGCEIYDTSLDTWRMADSMETPRAGHASLVLPDGRVLVIGGLTVPLHNYGTTTCELYDPESDVWGTAASLNEARAFFTAHLINHDEVLVVGGYNGSGSVAGCEIYSISENRWTATASLPTGRDHHSAIALDGGNIMVMGGTAYGCGFFDNSLLFDVKKKIWISTPPLLEVRGFHCATLLPSGDMLITGGITMHNGSQNPALQNELHRFYSND